MLIREPMVQATHFYLRAAPDDNEARRRERYEAFAGDVRHQLAALAGWLALPAPALPTVPFWQGAPPDEPRLLVTLEPLRGLSNATASLCAYVLRNMFVLRLTVTRAGEHDQGAWALLDDVLNRPPNTPSWLHMTRYWCGIAPRLPEDLEQGGIKTHFGVLSLGNGEQPNVLVYPDVRTQTRAEWFLSQQALQLDWYPVMARYRLDIYSDHASRAARQQQAALDRVLRATQTWGPPSRLPRALMPLQAELDTLETTYREALADLAQTHAAAHELRVLAAEYRLALMRSGLWDTAPTVWEARARRLELLHAQVEADLHYVEDALQRIDLAFRVLNTRAALLQNERERLLMGMIALIGLALVGVLVVDTDPARLALRLAALLLLVLAGVWGWFWSRRGGGSES